MLLVVTLELVVPLNAKSAAFVPELVILRIAASLFELLPHTKGVPVATDADGFIIAKTDIPEVRLAKSVGSERYCELPLKVTLLRMPEFAVPVESVGRAAPVLVALLPLPLWSAHESTEPLVVLKPVSDLSQSKRFDEG